MLWRDEGWKSLNTSNITYYLINHNIRIYVRVRVVGQTQTNSLVLWVNITEIFIVFFFY